MPQDFDLPVLFGVGQDTGTQALQKLDEAVRNLDTKFADATLPSSGTRALQWGATTGGNGQLFIRNLGDSAFVLLFPDLSVTGGGLATLTAAAFTTAAPTSATAATGATDLTRKSEVDARLIATQTKTTGWNAASAPLNRPLFGSPSAAVTISEVFLLSDTAHGTDGLVNNFSYQVRNFTAANDLCSTPVTSNVPVTAYTLYPLNVDQNQTLAADDVLRLEVTENGTGGVSDLTADELYAVIRYQIAT